MFSRKKQSFTKHHDEHQELGHSKKNKVKNRSFRPRGFIARKAGVVTFWLLFGFMLLVVFVNIFDNSDEVEADQEITVKTNKAMSQEAAQFAIDFSYYYFTWINTSEGIKQRQEALSNYLGNNLNEHAGLEIENLSWNSNFITAVIEDTEEKGNDISHITLKVKYKLYQFQEDGVTIKEEKEIIKYFVVPVAYDGKSFGVYQLPKFAHVQEKTTLDKVTYLNLKRAEGQETVEVKQFLTTFFRSYAEDSQEQLNYLLTKDNLIQGLNNTMLFDKVKSVETFMADGNKEFVVFMEVTFIDPDTGVSFDTNYQLTVVQKNGKYVVSGMDNHKGQVVKQTTSDDSGGSLTGI
jgi:hypothetical protein